MALHARCQADWPCRCGTNCCRADIPGINMGWRILPAFHPRPRLGSALILKLFHQKSGLGIRQKWKPCHLACPPRRNGRLEPGWAGAGCMLLVDFPQKHIGFVMPPGAAAPGERLATGPRIDATTWRFSWRPWVGGATAGMLRTVKRVLRLPEPGFQVAQPADRKRAWDVGSPRRCRVKIDLSSWQRTRGIVCIGAMDPLT